MVIAVIAATHTFLHCIMVHFHPFISGISKGHWWFSSSSFFINSALAALEIINMISPKEKSTKHQQVFVMLWYVTQDKWYVCHVMCQTFQHVLKTNAHHDLMSHIYELAPLRVFRLPLHCTRCVLLQQRLRRQSQAAAGRGESPGSGG